VLPFLLSPVAGFLIGLGLMRVLTRVLLGAHLIRTMGTRFSHLEPIHGFAAETSAAAVIQVASRLGFPLSTTHVTSAGILGVDAAVGAWVLTIPVSAALGFVATLLGRRSQAHPVVLLGLWNTCSRHPVRGSGQFTC
jgi:phosphate/sulfate permease